MSNKFCPYPFQNIEICGDYVYLCCPEWNNYNSIGNLTKDTLVNIWNCEKAMAIREKILDNDFFYCDMKKCSYATQKGFEKLLIDVKDCKPKMEIFPKIIKLGYDNECDIACNICRDEIFVNDEKTNQLYDSYIDTKYLPMLKDSDIVAINTLGDAFGSRHSRKLIKRISETYENIKFDFQTNGLMCTEEMLKELNVYSKIYNMRVSLHATSKKTYGKVVKNGEKLFNKITDNLYTLKEIKKKYPFEFNIQMVVSACNYKEMADFVDFVKLFDGEPSFWEYKPINTGLINMDNCMRNYIASPEHPEHKNFLKVLTDKRFDEIHPGRLSPLFYELRQRELQKKKKSFWHFW